MTKDLTDCIKEFETCLSQSSIKVLNTSLGKTYFFPDETHDNTLMINCYNIYDYETCKHSYSIYYICTSSFIKSPMLRNDFLKTYQEGLYLRNELVSDWFEIMEKWEEMSKEQDEDLYEKKLNMFIKSNKMEEDFH